MIALHLCQHLYRFHIVYVLRLYTFESIARKQSTVQGKVFMTVIGHSCKPAANDCSGFCSLFCLDPVIGS